MLLPHVAIRRTGRGVRVGALPVDAVAEVLRRVYAAYAAKDLGELDTLFASDIVMHVPGRHPLSGEHRGKDAVWAYLGQVAAISGGTGGFDVHAITTDGVEHGVALTTGTIRDFVRPVVHVAHVRDGQVTEVWEASLDQAREDAFWQNAGAG